MKAVALQIAAGVSVLVRTGVGFTVMVNDRGVPVHVFDSGVTVIVALIGNVPPLVARKELMLPVADKAASPTAAFVFVHWYAVLVTNPVNVTVVVEKLLQMAWSAMVLTVGVGYTVIEKAVAPPLQLFDTVDTFMIAVIGTADTLVAAKALIVPDPDVANPIAEVVLVQLKVVLATEPEKITVVVGKPLHSVCALTAFTLGVGLTVMEKA